jgi:hypothetical protein
VTFTQLGERRREHRVRELLDLTSLRDPAAGVRSAHQHDLPAGVAALAQLVRGRGLDERKTNEGIRAASPAMRVAASRLRTGERHPQATPWHQLKAELGLPD